MLGIVCKRLVLICLSVLTLNGCGAGGVNAFDLLDAIDSAIQQARNNSNAPGITAPKPLPQADLVFGSSQVSMSAKAGTNFETYTLTVKSNSAGNEIVEVLDVPSWLVAEKITDENGGIALKLTPKNSGFSPEFGTKTEGRLRFLTFLTSTSSAPIGEAFLPVSVVWQPNLRLQNQNDSVSVSGLKFDLPEGFSGISGMFDIAAEGLKTQSSCKIIVCALDTNGNPLGGSFRTRLRIEPKRLDGTPVGNALKPGVYTDELSISGSDGSTLSIPIHLRIGPAIAYVDSLNSQKYIVDGEPSIIRKISIETGLPLSNSPSQTVFAFRHSTELPFKVKRITPLSQVVQITEPFSNQASFDSLGNFQGSSNTQQLSFRLQPTAGNLGPGTHFERIRFEFEVSGVTQTYDVDFEIRLADGNIVPNPQSVRLGGVAGTDKLVAQFPVPFRQVTGYNAYDLDWKVVSKPAWLKLSLETGTGIRDLAVTIDRDLAPQGTRASTIVFETRNFAPKVTSTVEVTSTYQSIGLTTSADALLLTKAGSTQALTGEVAVRDSLGAFVGYTASADQPWLVLHGSGMAGQALRLVGDPTGLTVDTLHTATVTLRSTSDPTAVTKVKVGLWIASNLLSEILEPLLSGTSEMIFDKRRPILYFVDRGANKIQSLNYLTGSKVEVFSTRFGDNFKIGLDRYSDHLLLEQSVSVDSIELVKIKIDDFTAVSKIVNGYAKVLSNATYDRTPEFSLFGTWLPGKFFFRDSRESLIDFDENILVKLRPEGAINSVFGFANTNFGATEAGFGSFREVWWDIDRTASVDQRFKGYFGSEYRFQVAGRLVNPTFVSFSPVAPEKLFCEYDGQGSQQCYLGLNDQVTDATRISGMRALLGYLSNGQGFYGYTNSPANPIGFYDNQGGLRFGIPFQISQLSADGLVGVDAARSSIRALPLISNSLTQIETKQVGLSRLRWR